MTDVRIDPLRTGDAEVVARLQDDLWRTTYDGLLPQWVFDARDEADNVTRWRDRAAAHEQAGRSPEGARTLVAHDADGRPIGWVTTGRPRDEDPPADVELWSLYLAVEHHGSGVADQLLGAALAPMTAAYLWVLEGNLRAIAYYRKVGFEPDGATKDDPDLAAIEIRLVRRPAAQPID